MIDFDLTRENLVRENVERVKVNGAYIPVKYRLHKEDRPDPDDPVGSPITFWCLHVPHINQAYVDTSEELVFEALHEFFQDDMIRYYALKFNEARDSMSKKKGK